ncbi:hypothetical protein GP982_23700 [Escherichia coli]|uniref:Lipoprotein n=1 Tax=Escherichia coli TaxID=562 RepID=A0A6D0I7K2_ECOLX|nr:hypothetical protein [Escherichia coli]EKG4341561.1 hypothetical protein [Salmonella enterica]EFO1595700.1 hypothetical protein [Escherichia coli]EKQ3396245.1 hypothetical protein [Escherichia coli]KAE9862099.1 hypothetical protein GP667_23610 [Escherichia coli]MBZ8873720.1 hypothetical protein [Escherichia coli]
MHRSSNLLFLSLMLFSVTGCSFNQLPGTIISRSPDKTLSPPADTKWVNIEIKNPSPYTKPFPLSVRYISYECQKKRISGFDGSVVSEPGYNVKEIPMQQERGDIWKAKVAMTGGGSCNWTLSAVTLGIEYTDATHLGKDLVPGSAVGVRLAFDGYASRNGQFDFIGGNQFDYYPKYYPFIKKWSDSSQGLMHDKLYLFTEEESIRKIKINFNKNEDVFVNYRPLIDESKKVVMTFPTQKGSGAKYTFEYPDGSVVKSKNINPDFKKIEAISSKG